MPNPPAAFSPLAATKSSFQERTNCGRRCNTIARPLRPTMSPMKRIRIRYSVRALTWVRVLTQTGPGRTALFDHFVGAHEQRGWYFDAERLCSLEIDDKLELGRCLHWKLARFGTLKDAIDIGSSLPVSV